MILRSSAGLDSGPPGKYLLSGLRGFGKLSVRTMASGNHNLDDCYSTAVDLARKAGEIVLEGYKAMETKNFSSIETKASDIDLVTEYDKKVEDFLFSGLKDRFPDHKFIGEESASVSKSIVLTDDPTWVIDPIDGTMNFVHRFPYSAICIGLLINKQVEIGIVYHVAPNQMYTARRGQGAYCDKEKLKVSPQTALADSLVIAELGGHRDPALIAIVLENMRNVQLKSHGIRMMGSAALNMCMVAKGVAQSYYEFGIHIWDMAASSIIVTEAGGVVVDPCGGEFDLLARRLVCACCSTVAKEVSSIIEPLIFERDG